MNEDTNVHDGLFENPKDPKIDFWVNLSPFTSENTIKRVNLEKKVIKELKESQIIQLTGISGIGKSDFLSDVFANGNLQSNKVVWHNCSTDDSEEILLDNFRKKGMPIKSSGSFQDQVDSLMGIISNNNAVIVLDDFQKTAFGRFPFLIKEIISNKNGALVCVSNIDQFDEKYSKVVKPIYMPEGFEKPEVVDYLSDHSITLSEKELINLKRITGFMPFGLQLFVSNFKDNPDIINSNHLLSETSREFNTWKKSIEKEINEELVVLLKYLSHVDGTFSTDFLRKLLIQLKLEKSYSLIDVLRPGQLIFTKNKSGRFKLNNLFSKSYRDGCDVIESNEIYKFLGDYFRVKDKDEGISSNLLNCTTSIKYFQFGKEFGRAKISIKSNIWRYKRAGRYKEILDLIKSQENTVDTPWLNYHRAHINFILGNYDKCLIILRENIYNYYRIKSEDEKKIQDLIRQELKFYLLYTELLSTIGLSDYAIDILVGKINKIVNEDYSISYLDWSVVSQIISNLAHYYTEKGDGNEALRILRKMENATHLSQDDLPIAILKARIGIAKFVIHEGQESVSNLKESLELFIEVKDQRGIAWVHGYLIRNYISDQSTLSEKEVYAYLNTFLDLNSKLEVFDLNYLATIKLINSSNIKLSNSNTVLISNELKRLEKIEIEAIGARQTEEYKDISNVILSLLDLSNLDMYDLINRLLDKKMIKIGSLYFQSYIRNTKKNSNKIVAYIFNSFDKSEIFNKPYINKIISESAKFNPSIIDKYVIPRLSFIINHTSDSVKLHYARALNLSERFSFALRLLEQIETKNAEFYNLSGNANKKANFNKSYLSYSKAISLSQSMGEKARILNNQAWLIYENKRKSLYDQGISICKESLRHKKYNYYNWPYALNCMILIELEKLEFNDFFVKAIELLKKNKLNSKTLVKIIPDIHDPRKAKIINKIMTDNLLM